MVRVVLKFVVAVLGIALVATLLFNAIHDANLFGYAKAAIAALVTIQLLSLLGRAPSSGAAAGIAGPKNTKLIATGLVIGLGGPFLLVWLFTSFAK